MRKSLTIFAVAAAIASTIIFVPILRASGFTLGNLVIYRVGDGVASLPATGTAVFLDEYTPGGTLVQSIPMPTSVSLPNKRLVASGTATSEGQLTQSTDGRFLIAVGYDGALATTVAGTTSAAINRVIARVDLNGAVDTTTALTDAASGSNPRGATSTDGSNFWIDGGAGGIRYTTLGSTTSLQVNTIPTPVTNLRQTNIFGGQLYASSASGTLRLGAVGTGIPTTIGQTITQLPGIPGTLTSPYGFFFAHLATSGTAIDTVYIADDSTTTGGLLKYSLVSGSWVANGAAVGTTFGVRSLTGSVNNGTATLYVTSSSGLFKLTDTGGYNLPIAGSLASLVSAPANTAFRGIAFTPTNSTPPSPTNPTGVGSTTSVQAGGSTQLTVTVTPGANPTSSGLAVKADLTSIGGSATQVFTNSGNTFSFQAAVPAGTSVGTKSILASISDAQGRSASASITVNVTAAMTSPTGVGTAVPSLVRVGNTTTLTVTVTPGANPPSTAVTVVGDLSLLGGSSSQSFADNGGNVFTYTVAVPANNATGTKSLPITIKDFQSRTSAATISVTVKPPPPSTTLKISQVYGGGGNSGSTYTNDFVELFNTGSTPVDITGWSVQYSSSGSTGPTAWTGGGGGNLTSLCPTGPCFVQPGQYFMVQESAGAGGTTVPPLADVVGTIQLAAGAAKIALVASTDPLTGTCPVTDDLVDFVGYGSSANCSDVAPTASLSATLAAVRRSNGCIDTNNNANDFIAIGPIPRNSASPFYICGGNASQPSGVGIGVPSSIEPAAETLLTVQVAPAVTPPSTALTVTADLTAIGGLTTQQLFDDGSHGDLTSGDGVFSFLATIPPAETTGAKNIVATIIDGEGRTATAPMTLTIVSPTCGVERWSVKVGTDSTVGLINLTPVTYIGDPSVPASILNLGAVIPPPETDLAPPSGSNPGGPLAFTRSSPIETTVFTVDAFITFYKKETDVDYHIVLQDRLVSPDDPVDADAPHTLISEIPSPACIIAQNTPRVLMPSPLADAIARSRAKFDAHLSAMSAFQVANIPVRVTGVGFFDFEHGQTGVAPNAIELHPILDISFRGNTATALMSNENPSIFGDTVQLTATVTGGDGTTVPSGDVVFFDGGNSFTAVLDANGQAKFTTNALTAGTHSIVASYPGDDTSVPSTSAPVIEVVSKANQTIDFATIAGHTFGDADFAVSGGATSGLPVSFSIQSGPATISGSVVHLTGAGTVIVRAEQAGNDNYNPADPVERTFVVAPAVQTIVFGALPDRTFGGPAFAVSASGGASGNPVTFTAVGSCSAGGVNGSAITLTGIGPCTVTASQAGSANYAAAADVPRAFQVFDRTAPAISSVTPSVTSLWPPNKKMVPVSFAVSVTDDADPAPVCLVIAVSSNEGDAADWQITGSTSVELRSDRAGNGNGRSYIITVRCTDASGNASTATAVVSVPHDQGK